MVEQLRKIVDEWGVTTPSFFFLSSGLFLITFFCSLLVSCYFLIQLPADYFSHGYQPTIRYWERHWVLRWTVYIVKNMVGMALLLLGILLSLPFVPGQGILTILVGIILLDFPKKRYLERKLISQPIILQKINALRGYYHHSPLLLDDDVNHPKS